MCALLYNGNRATLTLPNGVTTSYAYNNANLLTSLMNSKGENTVSSYIYSYNLDGNQSGKVDNTGKAWYYTYDGLGRLTRENEMGGNNMAYTYDARGNRLTLTVTGQDTYTTSYAYDDNNRLLTEKRVEGGSNEENLYSYDPNGNTIAVAKSVTGTVAGLPSVNLQLMRDTPDSSRMAIVNTYDGFNRLTRVENGSGITTYGYHPDGLRSYKEVNGIRINQVWHGSNLVFEENLNDGLQSVYIRGNG